MLGFLKGKIDTARWGIIFLDVNDVGYKINIPPQIKIPEPIVGKVVKLYIHQHIREDADDLYGFLSYQELELFEKLISVSGIGPKAGMAIMSVSEPEKIIAAISSEDIGFFTAIPGIGKKVATKIILDLKSKIAGTDIENILSSSRDAGDVVDAMMSLGYKKQDILPLITKIPADLSTSQEKVKWLLKNLKA